MKSTIALPLFSFLFFSNECHLLLAYVGLLDFLLFLSCCLCLGAFHHGFDEYGFLCVFRHKVRNEEHSYVTIIIFSIQVNVVFSSMCCVHHFCLNVHVFFFFCLFSLMCVNVNYVCLFVCAR